jgi:hypothetical protein
MAKWVDEGENRVLAILFGSTAVDATLYLGIYTNTTEPLETATLASLTEPSGNNYARKSLSRGTWSVTADLASYAQQTFTASGGDWGACYGAFLATSSDGTGKLLSVEHFGSSRTINNGDSLKVTPNVRAS